ncbi:hypothetical protein THAOC_18332, partial [Thalassiosira oceanica]
MDLTVLIQTSPLPSHPSTALLDALLTSFDRVDRLKECRIVILADGCGTEGRDGDGDDGPRRAAGPANFKHGDAGSSPGVADAYRLHLDEVQRKIDRRIGPYAPSGDGSVELLRLTRRHGSACAVAEAFRLGAVTTRYVVVGQHDNFFVRDVTYLEGLMGYMDRTEGEGWLQCVHFPSTATIRYEEKTLRRYGIDLVPFGREVRGPGGARGRLVPLVFWYGRTSLARTRYYEEVILPRHEMRVGDHLEELWGTAQLGHLTGVRDEFAGDGGREGFEEAFRTAHARYGNYVFLEEGMEDDEVLYHLSGRRAVAAPPDPDAGGEGEGEGTALEVLDGGPRP